MENFFFPRIRHFRTGNESEVESLYAALFERIDNYEPELRIFEDQKPVHSRVLSQVREHFLRYPRPEDRPPLFCVPVGVKGIFRTRGERIRAGSLLPADLFVGEEARVVKELREQGAIILGITATTEFAFAAPAATCNPNNHAHTPGGSSSGSAAGVAAGFFPLALGTQTIGSIIRPASFCGITGFKPSYDILPTEGLLYFSRSADHVGLFCSSPEETETCLQALVPDFVPCPEPAAIRLGIPRGPYLDQALTQTVGKLEQCLEELAGGKAVSVEVTDIPCLENIAQINKIHEELIAAELAREHKQWFRRYQPLYRPQTASCILRGQAGGTGAISAGRKSQTRLRKTLEAILRERGLDAFVAPSATGEADRTLNSTGNPIMNLPWTHAGLPVISIPMGTGANGLPLGMQLAGGFRQDAKLLAVAKCLFGILQQPRRGDFRRTL
ncbi:MAG: amidase [Desulfovibrio sp.]|jgi:Asp-tRNA(Asn)/Glu-tRNA(Gln) amidotransferase A subunit family amidase|nr:amidase [Desulfovibrio sp.]